MSTFADYAFYAAHGGTLSQSVFDAVVDDAHAEILSQTNGAALTAPEVMRDAVKLCECALVDTIAAYRESAAKLLPKGIGSVNNDGYIVSAGAAGVTSAFAAEMRERAAICARFLQFPVNLMCRWA